MNGLRYTRGVVGHSSTLRVIVALLLVGSAAAAQQGLIAEPWAKPAGAPRPAVAAPRQMPESGLGRVVTNVSSVVEPPRVATSVVPEEKEKWSPPVVPLLVDPWKRTAVLPPPPRPRWLPSSPEIVDPWAKPSAETPRVAVAQPIATPPRSTIF